MTGQACGMDWLMGPLERLSIVSAAFDQTEEMDWKSYGVAMLLFNAAGFVSLYGLQRLQRFLPLNPASFGGGRTRPGLQHRLELHDQYELAGVWRGNDPQLPHPDARPDGAELRLCRDGHGHARCADPRVEPEQRRRPWEISGAIWPAARSISFASALPLSLLLVSQGVVQTFNSYQTATLLQPADLRQVRDRCERPAGA